MKPVPSPCINVCTLDAAGRVCLGCHRTLDEIAAWGGMPDAERARVMALLPGRKAQLEGGDAIPCTQCQPCANCGVSFGCGARDPQRACWCASFPPVAPTAGAACLCPACLAVASNSNVTG